MPSFSIIDSLPSISSGELSISSKVMSLSDLGSEMSIKAEYREAVSSEILMGAEPKDGA
jgi:hypothetical protein